MNDVGLMIQVDPNFDPLRHQISAKKCKPMSVRIRFPGQFEESHELSGKLSRFLLSQNNHHFKFFDDALESFKESVTKD